MGGSNLQTTDLTEGKHYRAVDAAKYTLETICVGIATMKTCLCGY